MWKCWLKPYSRQTAVSRTALKYTANSLNVKHNFRDKNCHHEIPLDIKAIIVWITSCLKLLHFKYANKATS